MPMLAAPNPCRTQHDTGTCMQDVDQTISLFCVFDSCFKMNLNLQYGLQVIWTLVLPSMPTDVTNLVPPSTTIVRCVADSM